MGEMVLDNKRRDGMPEKALASANNRTARFLRIVIPLEVSVILICYFFTATGFYNFFREGRLLTVLSSLQILMIAVTCFASAYLILKVERDYSRQWSWFLAGCFFLILSADEIFMIHEEVAMWVGFLTADTGFELSGTLRDIPFFLLYMATAAALWLGLRGEIQDLPMPRSFLYIGGFFLLIAMLLDALAPKTLRVLWEDSFKILGFMLLWSSSLHIVLFRSASLGFSWKLESQTEVEAAPRETS